MFHHTVCAYVNASANKGSERNFPVGRVAVGY